MKPLRTFRLEEYLGEWEFKVRYHLTASDAESITVEELLALGTDADREGLMKLPLSYIETWGTPGLREAVAGTYERVDAEHVLAFAGAEEALFWAMQELVGPGDHAVVTVPCYQAMETVTLATGADVSAWCRIARTAGRSTSTSCAPCCARPRSSSRSTSRTTRPATSPTRRPSASWWRCATSAASVSSATRCTAASRSTRRGRSPRRPTSPRRRLAQRGLQVLRPSRPARRLARLPRPGAARAAREAQALHVHLQRGARGVPRRGRSPEPRTHLGAQPRHRRGQPAALRRLLRPLGGPLRLAAAGGRLRLLPSLQGRRRRGLLRAAARRGGRPGACRRACTARRSPTSPRTTSVSESAGWASKRASRPSTASCGHRTKFAASERFRTVAVRYLLPRPAALILGASGSRIYLVDGPRLRSYRGALGGTHTRSCGRTADCVQGGSKCRKSCTSR